jgi:ethanolamine utilization protein EutQ (cupin superfamily)
MIVRPFDSEKSGNCGFKVRASCGSKDAGLVGQQMRQCSIRDWSCKIKARHCRYRRLRHEGGMFVLKSGEEEKEARLLDGMEGAPPSVARCHGTRDD